MAAILVEPSFSANPQFIPKSDRTISPKAQETYETTSSRIVDEGCKIIQKHASIDQIDGLFDKLLSFFSHERHQIAISQRVEMADYFGAFRSHDREMETPLKGKYERYSQKWHDNLTQKPKLKGRIRDFTVQDGKTENILETYGFNGTVISTKTTATPHSASSTVSIQFSNSEDTHELSRLSTSIFEESPSIIHLTHTPEESKYILSQIENIFKEAVLKEGSEIGELQKLVSLFRFVFAHAMPFARGSAAIAEWFERSIYQFNGLKVLFNSNHSIDLEAFTSTPDIYFQLYSASMVALKPKTKDLS